MSATRTGVGRRITPQQRDELFELAMAHSAAIRTHEATWRDRRFAVGGPEYTASRDAESAAWAAFCVRLYEIAGTDCVARERAS